MTVVVACILPVFATGHISLFTFFPFQVYYLRKQFLIISDMPEWIFMSMNDFEFFYTSLEDMLEKCFNKKSGR